jgi:hypothetical protein
MLRRIESHAGSSSVDDRSDWKARNSAWRAQVLVEVHDAQTQLRWLRTPEGGREELPADISSAYADAAQEMLRLAHLTASESKSFRGAISGANIQAASQYLQSAKVNLLRLSPDEYLVSQLPEIETEAKAHLRPNDPRISRLQLLTNGEQQASARLSRRDRSSIISAVQGLNRETQKEQSRVRSFRNVIVGVSLAITGLVLALAIVGWSTPSMLPMCFVPDPSLVVCPTDEDALSASVSSEDSAEVAGVERDAAQRWDISVVAFIGLLGASLAAATGLRTIRGSSDPFSLPVALALLKLPTGAFTAVLGLFLIRAGFVPGLSALDTSAQILAYAILLGYSQQLFTTFVDRQAQSVLAEAGSTTLPQPQGASATARTV